MIRIVYDLDGCIKLCSNLGNMCNSNCTYYTNFKTRNDSYIISIINQSVIFTLFFVIDLYFKIKQSLFENTIISYNFENV